MKRRGFSLLELSIVLTILAIVVASGLTLGTAKIQQDEVVDTYDEMEEIAKAMRVFLNEYDRLPCPASITLTATDPLYGREATDCADGTPPAGLVRVEYPAASTKYVRIGGVPFYSLQLPDKFLEDRWNGRYLYAVRESFITSLTSSDTGNIRVVDNSGTVITDDAAMVLVSHGKSREGAYTAKTGAQTLACDATNRDGENCDNDGIFTDAVYNDGDVAANFFDDLIIWKTRMNMFETVSTSGSNCSTAAFAPAGFPDGVKCKTGGTEITLPFIQVRSTGDTVYGAPKDGVDNYLLIFTSAGAYSSNANLAGFDCVAAAMAISALETAGQTFNDCAEWQ